MNIDGTLNAATLARLKAFLDQASQGTAPPRNMLVDVTLTRDTVGDGTMTFANYKTAVRAVATELRGYRNVLFDVQNEYPGKMEPGDAQELIQAIHSIDPGRVASA